MTAKKSAKKTTRIAVRKQSGPAKTSKTSKATKPVEKKVPEVATKKSPVKIAAKPAAPPKPPKSVAHMVKDQMSGMYFFTLDEVRCPIDHEDLPRTLGAGQYGYGRGLVDQWSTDVWQKILAHLDLPTEPLVREIAAVPVKRFVQSVWLKAFNGRVLEESKELFESRDKAAVKNYAANLEKASVAVEEKRERAVTNLVKGPRTPGVEKIYRATDALKDKKLVFTGQPLLIIECLRKTKFADTTCKQLADALTKAGLKTAQPAERVAMHYLNLWRGKGWLEVING